MQKRYGLVGEKLPHSFSKQIHEILWVEKYDLIELKRDEVEAFFRKKDFGGVNVTIPYKKTAMDCCDVVDENAKKIGCVNTVVNKNGVLYGYNTDYDGFICCVGREGIGFFEQNVLILGTGATSKTVCAAVKACGAKSVKFVSRNGEINYENIYEYTDTQVIINTTPVGMFPDIDGQSVDLSRFENLVSYVDVVYNPLRTRMYQQAKSLNKQCCCGLAMLVGQAVYAARHFSEKPIDNLAIERTLAKLLPSRTNIVLTGMPGCGKSTIGKLLAEKLGRKVYDSDELIEKNAGMPIPEIFEKYGEAHFRDLEAKAILELSKLNGVIISTGGGAVMREENRLRLSQNGRVYFIKRDIERLARGGRPLSTGLDALNEMYSKREPVYTAFADVIVENNGQLEDAAQRIWSEFI